MRFGHYKSTDTYIRSVSLMEMRWDGTMAALANMNCMTAQPAFCTSDPIAEV
jgi:hypothetical protein